MANKKTKKSDSKKPPSKGASSISRAEYERMLNSGWTFAAREMNPAAVRANQRANMYMAPGSGISGKGRVVSKPPRPMNPNRTAAESAARIRLEKIRKKGY